MADGRSRDAPVREKAERHKSASAFDFKSGRAKDERLGDLVRQLAGQASHLAEKQGELLKAELASSVADLKEAAGAMAGAAVLGLAGVGVTLMGVAYLLGSAMPLWLATLVVGVAALAGGYGLFLGAQKKLHSKSMTAGRTRRTLERAPNALAGQSKEDERDRH